MYRKEIGINTRNWVDQAQDKDYCKALVTAALYIWIPEAIKLVKYLTYRCEFGSLLEDVDSCFMPMI